MPNQGFFEYGGANLAIDSFSINDVHGITPAIACAEVYLEYGAPAADGDLVLTYNNEKITFKNCHVDSVTYTENASGKLAFVRFVDERWKWSKASITLRANQRLPNNFVNPYFEVGVQQLAALCFEALGVTQYDVSALPADDRPDVDWDHANPAQELANICDRLGCRVVPKRSDGSWVIREVGVGNQLPDGPIMSVGNGINPKQLPDYIKVVTAPIRYQFAVELEPAGKTMDLVWGTLKEVAASLKPSPPSNTSPFGFRPFEFENVSPTRVRMADGTKKSPKEFAEEYVLRTWRVRDDEPFGKTNVVNDPKSKKPVTRNNKATIFVPGYPDKVYRKQMVILNELAQAYIDGYGEQHNRPAFMFGVFRGNKIEKGCNYPFGTRIDAQTWNYDEISLEERKSFSIHPDQLDADKTVIQTSDRMIYTTNYALVALGQPEQYDVAKLWLMCAVNIKDLQTFQPARYEYYYRIGNGTNKNFCEEVLRDDIKPYFIQEYPLNKDDWKLPALPRGALKDNKQDVDAQCKYYAVATARNFIPTNTENKVYPELRLIDMDGAIQMVSYKFSKGGYDTIASFGNEHNWDLPPYWERRQRDGRQNPQAYRDLIKEITARQDSLKGSFNT